MMCTASACVAILVFAGCAVAAGTSPSPFPAAAPAPGLPTARDGGSGAEAPRRHLLRSRDKKDLVKMRSWAHGRHKADPFKKSSGKKQKKQAQGAADAQEGAWPTLSASSSSPDAGTQADEYEYEDEDYDTASAASEALPRLPPSSSPDDPSWRNSMALCVSMRDENVTDVREWLLYYRWLGVDRVFLTDNNSAVPLEGALKDFIESGFVSYRWESESDALMKIHSETFARERSNYSWIAFFDADEYLVLRDRNDTLKALLSDFKHEAGLAVHMVRFGWNMRALRPEQGGTMRHYTMCENRPADYFKTIMNVYYVKAMADIPHTAVFWDDRRPVNDAGDLAGRDHESYPTILPPSIRRVALFHLQVKSAEDYAARMRISGMNRVEGMAYFDRVNSMAGSVAPLCRELAQVADECCPEADLVPPLDTRPES